MQLRSAAVPGRSRVDKSKWDPIHYQVVSTKWCLVSEPIRSPDYLLTTGGWTFLRPRTGALPLNRSR
jgi:hypothetical protein